MLCLACGYYRVHEFTITKRRFCSITGEKDPQDNDEVCPFFAPVTEHRDTFPEKKVTVDGVDKDDIPASKEGVFGFLKEKSDD